MSLKTDKELIELSLESIKNVFDYRTVLLFTTPILNHQIKHKLELHASTIGSDFLNLYLPACTLSDVGYTKHMPFWWPTNNPDAYFNLDVVVNNPDKTYFLYFDGVDQSKPIIRDAISKFFISRKINGQKLPNNFKIIASLVSIEEQYLKAAKNKVWLNPSLDKVFNTLFIMPPYASYL